MGHTDSKLYWALRSEVARGNVSMRGDLDNYVIFKYNQDCVINDAWNGTNRQARGIIFYAPTERIVCRPFDKFFNLDERGETQLERLPDADFIVWEKLDGSCCSSFLYFNQLRVATPGSYESEQAKWASEWLNNHLIKLGQLDDFKRLNKEMTFIFEGIWPESAGNPAPPVLDYGDREELVLLAVRSHHGQEANRYEVDTWARAFNFARPKRFESHIGLTRNLKEQIPDDEEGYVVQYPSANNFRVKVKSPHYMMLHRTMSRLTRKGICEIYEAGEGKKWIKSLPRHISKRADDMVADLKQDFYKIFYLVDDSYKEASTLKTRKEQALYILEKSNLPKAYAGLVFAKLDGKYDDKMIWGILKNENKHKHEVLQEE